MFKPELLSPAGTLKNMKYAFAYGADAIYAGQPRYSLRARNNEFNNENLQIGIKDAHELGKKFYLVTNIIPHDAKLKTFINDLKPVIQSKPDALIMSDPGLIMLVREKFPEVPIHLSVQANTVNWAAVKFWHQIGLSRVILSRELSIEEIQEIRFQVPEVEIEVFVHGSLCVAYSGRCLISNYISKRDPNQGVCTNICREKYNVIEGQEDDVGNIVYKNNLTLLDNTESKLKINDQVFIVKGEKHPDKCMNTFEDEHGTYFMNSKDLCAITHIERLIQIGVHSLKIEGRTKSFYYCARTAQSYRKAIDDSVAGRSFDLSLLKNLEGLAHRGYTEGFLRRHTHDNHQNYNFGHSISKLQQFVGEFTGEYVDKLAVVEVKNKFSVGDYLELMTPQGNVNFTLNYMKNFKGEELKVAPGDGYKVQLSVPENIQLKYALLIRNLYK